MRYSSFIVACLFAVQVFAQTTTRIELNYIPAYQPANSSIYIAGSFNGWKPNDERFQLQRTADGRYTIDLKLPDGDYEFKFTRGSWEKVECAANGASISNRILQVPAAGAVQASVTDWADHFSNGPRRSTASKNVKIIDTALWIPQLQRTRTIRIYLPASYGDGYAKKYPVLYMQDGQNLFDDATSFAGEWGIDEFFDTTQSTHCIVVGIDHGNGKRINEYNPYDHTEFGKGEGKAYADFIVKTLKPFIDKHYRTKKDREHTYIAGSSLGGLISFTTILRYPKVFGGAGIFSPSFWLTRTTLPEAIRASAKKIKGRVYFYAGKAESADMVTDLLQVFQDFTQRSKAISTTVIRDEGKHNEATWRREFPLFYEWLQAPHGSRKIKN